MVYLHDRIRQSNESDHSDVQHYGPNQNSNHNDYKKVSLKRYLLLEASFSFFLSSIYFFLLMFFHCLFFSCFLFWCFFFFSLDVFFFFKETSKVFFFFWLFHVFCFYQSHLLPLRKKINKKIKKKKKKLDVLWVGQVYLANIKNWLHG